MPTNPIISQLRRHLSFRSANTGEAGKSEMQSPQDAFEIADTPKRPDAVSFEDVFADASSPRESTLKSLTASALSPQMPLIPHGSLSPLLPPPPPRADILGESSWQRIDADKASTSDSQSALADWVEDSKVTAQERAARAQVLLRMSEVMFGEESYTSIRCLSPVDLLTLTYLPEKLIVREGFRIDEDSALICLPDFLRVAGSLEITGGPCLSALPYALFVEGDLILGRQTPAEKITSSTFAPGHSNTSSLYGGSCRDSEPPPLPFFGQSLALGAHLTVLEDFTLRSSVRPLSLPASLAVGGSLRVEDARLLRCFGPSPSVGQNVSLYRLEQSERLFDAWAIAGRLTITRAYRLREISSGLSVGGGCEIDGARSLEDIASDAEFFADLYLSELISLETLPPGLVIGRDLFLQEACALVALPDRLGVGRHLRLTRAWALRRFGRTISVGGNVLLSEASQLVTLPTFLVGGKAMFLECSALERLSPAQDFPRGLHLIGSVRLAALPGLMKVGEELIIERGLSLLRLNSRLRLRTLSISDAPKLTALPACAEVTCNLVLRSMPMLRKLPSQRPSAVNLTLIDLPLLTVDDSRTVEGRGRTLILRCPQLPQVEATSGMLSTFDEASFPKSFAYQELLTENDGFYDAFSTLS